MTIDIVKDLYYKKGLSCREIGEKLNMTVWQVIRFMKKNRLKLRKPEETQKLQFYKKPLSFNKKSSLSNKEKLLFQSGMMLYWAEGAKTNNRTVDLANSDEKILLIFIKMLRNIYQINERKIRILVYCYKNQNSQKLIKYWSEKLQVSSTQFIKPYIRNDYNINKINKMPHGLIHIRYNDKKLFMKIFEEIAIMSDKLLNR
jgi:predicted DNA-binding protein YlxM (UPF0122 family)